MGTATAREHCHRGPRTNFSSSGRRSPLPPAKPRSPQHRSAQGERSELSVQPSVLPWEDEESCSRQWLEFPKASLKLLAGQKVHSSHLEGGWLTPLDGGVVHTNHHSTSHQTFSLRQENAGFEQGHRETLRGQAPCSGLRSTGCQTQGLHRIPPHHLRSLAAPSLGAGRQPGSDRAVATASPVCSCPAPRRRVWLLCASALSGGRTPGAAMGGSTTCSKASLPAEGQHHSSRGLEKGCQGRRNEGG